jgi:hypothetical protein
MVEYELLIEGRETPVVPGGGSTKEELILAALLIGVVMNDVMNVARAE